MSRLFFALCVLVLWGCTGSSEQPNHVEPGEGAAAGRKLYDKYCRLCHGEAGQGYAADNAGALANPDFLASAADGFLWTAIEQGRPGTAMAAYSEALGGPLENADINLIIAYLRSLVTEEAVEVHADVVKGDAQAGEAVFAERCAGCHGDKGQGKTALSLSNPMFLASASDGFIRYAIQKGRRGTPMAAYEKTLEPRQIDDLTRLIRSWTRNVPSSPAVGEVPPTFEQVVINPGGPAPEFSELREGRFVPADEVKKALDAGARIILLDARPTSDWLRSHIPGALPMPYYDGDKMVRALPKDGTWIVSYCACPHAASGHVMDMLRKKGFDKTAVLDEGILIWTARGYPLTFGATP